ncbi:MAG: hypothetical protein ACD_79C00793G0001 [uncultured bacterium]|nr:MAG: hypothetical protein ACD_79C00793G0001 [uncultured bacterium]
MNTMFGNFKKIFYKFFVFLLIANHVFVFAAEIKPNYKGLSLNKQNLSPTSIFASYKSLQDNSSSVDLFTSRFKKGFISLIVFVSLLAPIISFASQPKSARFSPYSEQIINGLNGKSNLAKQNLPSSNEDFSTEKTFRENWKQFNYNNSNSEISANYFIMKHRYDNFPYNKPFLSKPANERVQALDSFLTQFYNQLDLDKAELDSYMTSKINLINEKSASPELIKMLIVDLLFLKTIQPDIYYALVEKNTSILYTSLDMHGNAYGDSFWGSVFTKRSFITLSEASISSQNYFFRISTLVHEGQHIKDLSVDYTGAIAETHKGIIDPLRSLPSVESPAFEKGDEFVKSALNINADSSFYEKERKMYFNIQLSNFFTSLMLMVFEFGFIYFFTRGIVNVVTNTNQENDHSDGINKRIIRSQNKNFFDFLVNFFNFNSSSKSNYNRSFSKKSSFIKQIGKALNIGLDIVSSSFVNYLESFKIKPRNSFNNTINLLWLLNEGSSPFMSFEINNGIDTFDSFIKNLEYQADDILDKISNKAKFDKIFRLKIGNKYGVDNYYKALSEIFISGSLLKNRYPNSLPSFNTLLILQKKYSEKFNYKHVNGMLSVSFILDILNLKYIPAGNPETIAFITELQMAA